MQINFRQGIVQYNHPNFVQIAFPYVNLVASTQSPFMVNIAAGDTNYLHTEKTNIQKAWGPLSLGIDTWLYIDIDNRTAQRTFGTTTFEPITGAIAPTSPANGQHWYDTTTDIMKVWGGTTWANKIRVFACKLQGGQVPISMSINSPIFDGTQVGNLSSVIAGYMMFDADNHPLKSTADRFVTTEDRIKVEVSSVSDVKIASLFVEAEAQMTMPAYSVVVFSDFGKIMPATPFSAITQAQYGIIQSGAIVGDIVQVSIDGMITNPDWNWTSIGVNAYLYNDNSGLLQSTPTVAGQLPIAIVIDINTVMLVSKTVISSSPYAGVTVPGISTLSIPADDPIHPIVVGDNDPRLSDLRFPLSHMHPISDIIDLQSTIDELHTTDTTKLNITGGTLTGSLILHNDPINPSDAATKQYVDNATSAVTSNINFNELTDVVLTLPSTGQLLSFDGTNWINSPDINQHPGTYGSGATTSTFTVNGQGQVISASSTPISFDSITPNQSNNAGKFLSTDGTVSNWVSIVNNFGTVTSIDISSNTGLTISGGPITTSGTLSLGGVLSINHGGTGLTNLGTSLQVLRTNASATALEWANDFDTFGTVTSIDVSGGTTGLTLSGGPITSSGTLTLGGVLAIANGGTGQTTAITFNSLAPTQTGNTGKYLTTNGTNSSWAAIPGGNPGTVTSIDVSGGTTGLTLSGGPITSSGTLTLGGILSVANGGTGQTTAITFNSLAPTQTGNTGKYLTTNGTTTSWATVTTNPGTVTSVSVASANGFTGTVATSTSTPAITLTTSVTGVLKGNGTAISAATVGTDYSTGTSALTTGILKSTTTTGALSIAVAGDFPTLNQNTTGTAANVTGTVAIANGGTGQTTANAALNALVPTQTANTGKYLTTDGTNTSWAAVSVGSNGTVTSITGSGGTTGLTITGGPITTSGTLTLGGVLAVANGGTGQTTAITFNSLAPTQLGNIGKFLTTDGTNSSWVTIPGGNPGTVTSITGSGGTTGLTITGGPITSSGTLTLGGTLAIVNGGTGQTTSTASFNALVPTQTSNSGKYLTTDGTNTSWATISVGSTGTVTSITGSGGTTGLTITGGPITTSGTLTLGGTLAVANGGTGLSTLGTGLQVLRTNSGATALEWATASSVTPGGTYTTTGDANYANVITLIHCNGTNAGNVFTDNSILSGTIVPSNVTTSTTQSMFNGSSAYFTGTASYLSIPYISTTNIKGTTDFTWECFIRPEVIGGYLQQINYSSPMGLLIRFNTTGIDVITASGAAWTGIFTNQGTVTVNNWQHIAITRTSGTFRLFVGGALVATDSTHTTFNIDNSANAPIYIGAGYGGSGNYKGYMAELRISNISRYTTAFTPTTTSFPDSTTVTGSIQYNSAGGLGGTVNLTWDSINNRLGINKATPAQALDVVGNIAATGTILGSNLSGTNTGDQTFTSLAPTQTNNSGKYLTTNGTTASWKDLITNNYLYGWGQNNYAQMGNGSTGGDQSFPLQIGTNTNWIQAANSSLHTAAIKSDGTLWGCGYNGQSGIGDGTATNRYYLTQVGTGSNWSQVAVGELSGSAIKTDGTLWGWGQNNMGQLGVGNQTNQSTPTQVGTLTNWAQVACGNNASTLAVKTDGTFWACGYNYFGHFGNSTNNTAYSSPIQIGSNTNWAQASTSGKHSAAIKTDGTLWTCGYGANGQLGNNSTAAVSSPVQTIAGGNTWSQVSCGQDHTAAIKTDGTLWVWGKNSRGQCGDNTIVSKSSPVQTILGGTNWKQVVCGAQHTTALKTDGTLWICGYNGNAQYGVSAASSSTPVQIGTLTNWTQIAVGNGKTNSVVSLQSVGVLPAQTNNTGKYLTTDGINTSWITPFGRISNVTFSSSVSLNWTNVDIMRITLTGNITITNQVAWYDGQRCILELTQDSVGGRTVSFTSDTRVGTDVTYTPTPTALKLDRIGLIYNGTANKFDIISVARGY